jgi:hypothetical protein
VGLHEESDAFRDEQLRQHLDNDAAFCASQPTREQCAHACRLLQDVLKQPTPYARIGKVLGLNKGAIKYHKRIWKLQAEEIRYTGRPAAFSPEQLDQFVLYIKDSYKRRNPVMITDIYRFALDFRKQRRQEQLSRVAGTPGSIS